MPRKWLPTSRWKHSAIPRGKPGTETPVSVPGFSWFLPAGSVRRGADSALESPASDVIDLLLHGAGERNRLHSDVDEILFRDLPASELGFGQRRYDTLLDLGAGPASGKLRQLFEVEPSRLYAATAEVNLEDLDLFRLERQVDKKHLVETAFAEDLGGKKVDAVGRRGDEKSAGLFLHPGKEERENPALLSAGFGGRDSHFDLVEPQNRGRHVFHHFASFDECSFGLAMPAGEDLDHVHPV